METRRRQKVPGKGSNAEREWNAVPESKRMSIMERLTEFKYSAARELLFEAGLSNADRAAVHVASRRLGMKSKSSGVGPYRRVGVTKLISCRKAKKTAKQTSVPGAEETSVPPFSFSSESQNVLANLFTDFPPMDDELVVKKWDPPVTTSSSGRASKNKQKTASRGGTASRHWSMGPEEIARQCAALALRIEKSPALRKVAEKRSRLPIASFKDEITAAITNHQVVLIAGETGCGKTTQVPQYILDHMWAQRKPCRIICTQPRRISATSVAERIATERGENVGETVGYQIRLESRGGKHSSLMFCTNGVLLRKLVGQNIRDDSEGTTDTPEQFTGLDATHVIVDEIHERDMNADFLLIVLRDLLAKRPDLRVILMSATIDAEVFSNYFNGCPVVRVPGFTYPVETFYLEDVLALTKTREPVLGKSESVQNVPHLLEEDQKSMDDAITQAWEEDDFEMLMDTIQEFPRLKLCNYKQSSTGMTALMVAAGKGRVEDVKLLLSLGADSSAAAKNGHTAADWAETYGHKTVSLLLNSHKDDKLQSQALAAEAAILENYQMSVNQAEVDVALIERLLRKLYLNSGEAFKGSVLVFLPGWEDITRTRDCLQASSLFKNTSKFLVLPLHSMVPSSEQRKVFQSPPSGVYKIVLATNIAETSITIDDVVYVIDSGRLKEKSYDPYSNVSTLQTVWVSKASAKQREGRAGRCLPGYCYHLFSKVMMDAFPDFQLPEMKRTPLEEICLQVKLYEPHGRIADFLLKAMDPPYKVAVRNAVTVLQDIGALTSDELLTDLGKQLGSLPVHPSTSRMILLAILLNCLSPALTIACAAGFREPFVLPLHPHQKKQAQAARQELSAMYGGYSDHLSIVAAFDGWEAARARKKENQYCSRYFVSGGTMSQLAGMRKQLQGELAQKGFIPWEANPCSLNAQDPGIVRAVLAAGMYPMVGTLLPPISGNKRAMVETGKGEKVRIHPQSISISPDQYRNLETGTLNQLLAVFDEVTRAEAQVFIRKCTLVTTHPLLLLSTEMVVASKSPVASNPFPDAGSDDEENSCDEEGEVKDRPSIKVTPQERLMSNPAGKISIVLDRRLYFHATAVDAAQLFVLRSRLAAALNFKVIHPRRNLPNFLAESVHAIACLLSFDAMPSPDPPSASKDGENLKVVHPYSLRKRSVP